MLSISNMMGGLKGNLYNMATNKWKDSCEVENGFKK
jgi:hypothetical protein